MLTKSVHTFTSPMMPCLQEALRWQDELKKAMPSAAHSDDDLCAINLNKQQTTERLELCNDPSCNHLFGKL